MSVQTFQWQSQLALAKNALISGDYLTAEEYLTAAMTFSHDENAPEVAVADIFYHRGICFENKDRFVDARRAFNQAQHTFSRCLGATSSQALKASKAKCLVDLKMGRIAEAQSEFQEIIQLLTNDPGDFAAEIESMEVEMRKMLAHPEPPAIPGTEVEIEPYAESWTPVRRTSEFSKPVAQAVELAPALAPQPTGDKKVRMPSEVSDAIAHLSKSGQMAAVPESYLTGGVTERLTSIGNKFVPPVVISSEFETAGTGLASAAAEAARLAAAEASRIADEEESRRAQLEIQRVAAEEESRFVAAEAARITAEEAARFAAQEEAARILAQEEATRVAAENEALRIAEEEATRIAAAEESARIASEEASRIAAQEEAARVLAEEASRIAAQEEAARAAAEEASRIAAQEKQEAARLAAEEAARVKAQNESDQNAADEAARAAEEAEKALAIAADTARIAMEEEAARTAAETARAAAEEDSARAAAEAERVAAEEKATLEKAETTRIALEEESARVAAAESARVVAEEEVLKAAAEAARVAAEDDARAAAETAAISAAEVNLNVAEAARIGFKDDAFDTVNQIARKAEEIEQARNKVAETARKAAEEQEKNNAAAEAARKLADEEARLAADELARKTDEEARRAAAESRRVAEEEVRLASAEAARKAREEKAQAASASHKPNTESEENNAALSSDFEFDSSTSLTSRPDNELQDSWAPMPLSTTESAAPSEAKLQSEQNEVKVRIVRSQPEAFSSKRLDGTMIDMPARKPPMAAPIEPHLSFVKAQTPYPSELERRKEPPAKSDDQPERRQSILAQVADELAGQLAGQIEAQSSEKLAPDVASSLAAQVQGVAQATDHLAAHKVDLKLDSEPIFVRKEDSSTWSEVVEKSRGNSSPVSLAAAAAPSPFVPPAEVPSVSVFSRPPDLTPIPDKPSTNAPVVAWEPQSKLVEKLVESASDAPKRPYTKTMMDMSAAGVHEQAFLAANPLPKQADVIKDYAPAKNVDGAKVSEFQQRLSESAKVNSPVSSAQWIEKEKESASIIDNGPITELTPGNEASPAADDRLDRSKRPATSSKNAKIVQPVSQPKSLITPRHFIRPLSIPELINPREKLYTQLSTIAGVLLYILSIACVVGIVAIPLMMAIKFTRDGIKLGRIRGRGIRVTPEQFPEVFEAVHNLAATLGMPTAPDTYVVHEQGNLSVSANRLHGKDIVVVYADVLELAYSFGESELAFLISHELARIQCGHLNRAFIDFPAKRIPFLGAALSRSREYTCDKIAQELVPEGAAMGLVALSAGTKLYRRINLKALYAQKDADEDFWTRFSETLSSQPNLNNRIRALAPNDEKSKLTKPPVPSSSKRF